MNTRRDFLKKAGLLAGSISFFEALPTSIQAALAIDPDVNTSYLDAEHIVMLMQENRSFDHSFGTLRGVRGFNDPNAVKLANGNPVWLQSFSAGLTYAPFRLDIKNSKASWTSYLPHSWENQIGAWNQGKFDRWLDWKQSGYKDFKDIPLTLGYYSREDIPFYYAFADAFTICDQHFCSSLTGTTTNRHYFWTGKCTPTIASKPLVRNSDVYFSKEAHWKTFPERLQEHGISWKVYQNEVSVQNEISGNQEPFLGNFTDNNLEWFAQYNVRFKKSHIDFYKKRITELPSEIEQLEKSIQGKTDQKIENTLKQKKSQLVRFKEEVGRYSSANYERLSGFQKELHERAFQTNEGDPDYHETEKVKYEGEDINVPKGDVLFQFRQDVQKGNLPTVSWLVAPQHFSDHPSSPMYGAWYVSEVLNILTQDPEVWKKTIFILNYDENDGYFDHVPPFVVPKIDDDRSGKVSVGLETDIRTEYVTKQQELDAGLSNNSATEGPVGLGYRVPLIIASPWSRGGWVNSEVFDITSTIQFVEHFIHKKYGKSIVEENISAWRRAITGDLTSVFRRYDNKERFKLPDFLDRNKQIFEINKAKNKPVPDGYYSFSEEDIKSIQSGNKHHHLPQQEKGTKPSNALCYELYIHENIDDNGLELTFEAANRAFGTRSLGAGFNVYDFISPDYFFASYTAAAGKNVSNVWSTEDGYKLHVYGPNGFLRVFEGGADHPKIRIILDYDLKGNVILKCSNFDKKNIEVTLENAYIGSKQKIMLKKGKHLQMQVDTQEFGRWYDLTFTYNRWIRQFAGRVENGKPSITDPKMGDIL